MNCLLICFMSFSILFINWDSLLTYDTLLVCDSLLTYETLLPDRSLKCEYILDEYIELDEELAFRHFAMCSLYLNNILELSLYNVSFIFKSCSNSVFLLNISILACSAICAYKLSTSSPIFNSYNLDFLS